MRPFRLRTDLERSVVSGYALPLGLVPRGLGAPQEGYTVDFVPGEDDDPDTYSFHVAISHERLTALLDGLFDLFPEEVYPILEIGSRDAYRSVDVLLGQAPVPLDGFRRSWKEYEPFLVEDGSIAAGANSDEPLIEVFMDHWKGVAIHGPVGMRDDIERILNAFDLAEVTETWPEMDERAAMESVEVRPILELDDEYSPDVEELLLELRGAWDLELDDDPTANRDEAGRELGFTLWHALVILESVEEPERGTYASIWATASSRFEVEEQIEAFLEAQRQWRFVDLYALDRVAFDERPDELAELPPRRFEGEVHLVSYEGWAAEDASGPAPDERA